jgi:hypothetical protein
MVETIEKNLWCLGDAGVCPNEGNYPNQAADIASAYKKSSNNFCHHRDNSRD